MKRCFYSLMAAAGLLLSTACSNEDEFSRGNGNEALVSFDVELSGGMQTKTISDGKTAKNLVAGVFEVNENGTVGEELTALRKTATFQNESLSTTVSFNLVKGKTYSFVFWAQAQGTEATSPYNVTDLKSIKVSYENATANDESRDAFLGVVKNKKVEGSFEENVTLKRPFAQLNFLTDDIEAAKAAGLPVDGNTQSKIIISNAATTLDPFTNTVGGFTEAEVTFAAAKIPALTEKVSIGTPGTEYNYLGTTYFLVAAEGSTENAGQAKATLNSVSLSIEGVNDVAVTNVPAQWNYRTNIYGSLLTAEGKFNVEISPIYTGDHNEEVQTKQVATVDEVDEAIAAGATEVIVTEAPTQDATISIPKIFAQDNQTTIAIQLPETTSNKVTISESTTTGEGTNNQAPKEVAITAPTTNELVINLPNSTVTLNGQKYTSVTASTAANTLIIPEGVEVGKLTVNEGNVEIYGKVTGDITLTDGCYITAYAVSTPEELKKAGGLVTSTKKCKKIILKNNINLNGSASDKWTPMDTEGMTDFVFDGGGHEIANLYVDNYTGQSDSKGNYYGGLFNVLQGTVKDLTINNATVTCFRGGALVGRMDYGTVENCHVKNATVNSIQKVAGLVGFVSFHSKPIVIRNCSVSTCAMKAFQEGVISQAGGLIGYLQTGDRNVTIEGNSVSGISLTGVYTPASDVEDRVHALEQSCSHAFIGTVANFSKTEGAYSRYTITLSNNTVDKQVSGIPTSDRTDDYMGWWAGDYNTGSYPYTPKIVVDGVAKDRWIEVKRLMNQLREGGDVIVWRNYDLTKWDGFKLDGQQITEGDAVIEIANATNLTINSGATLTVGKQQIINKSTLTVKSEGAMSATDYIFMNEGSATLTINGGTYNAVKATDANGVVIYNQGKCVIENGTFNAPGFTLMNTGSADMTIKGGTVTNGGTVTSYALMAAGSGAKLTIEGGKIEALQSIGGAKVTINNGTIVNDSKYYAVYNQGGNTTINGGYISGATNYNDIYNTGSTVTIKGGFFEDNNAPLLAGYVYNENKQTVDGITYNYEVVASTPAQ